MLKRNDELIESSAAAERSGDTRDPVESLPDGVDLAPDPKLSD
jgi:hypothetical protein